MTNIQKYTNRLIYEKSPYLLQHAHNPVDWYPWGQEAFEAASHLDRPIFLSIGYASCHFCHEMERESFDNPHIAKLLNESFINIKVDREELPEIDSLYMDFAQTLMLEAPGWPLNIILTPNLMPFFASSYVPPRSRHGIIGLIEMVHQVKGMWESEERERIKLEAEKLVELFQETQQATGEVLPRVDRVLEVAESLMQLSDPIYGGIKGVSKFPVAYHGIFLLNWFYTSGDKRGIFLFERTLDMMQRGGIYDHLGGGFFRYSVDEKWITPHFEKMLYDNALLIDSYLAAWKTTKKPFYRETCCEVLQYVMRELSHASGGFYAGQDAETEGKEGWYYTWTREEIQNVLGKAPAELFMDYFNIISHENLAGRHVLHITDRYSEFAARKGMDPEKVQQQLEKQRRLLAHAREQREQPKRDTIILSSWNGLLIHSLACAGLSLQEPRYIDAAIGAAEFIHSHLWNQREGLLRRYCDGDSRFKAGLSDHAFLIRGLITLFETVGDKRWLDWAIALTDILEIQFKENEGAFFQTDGMDPLIILRKCGFSDGAEPSGNAVHAENLIRLFQITHQLQYLKQAEDIFRAVDQNFEAFLPGYVYHALALNRYYDTKKSTIVIVLNEDREGENELKKVLGSAFNPHRAIVWGNTLSHLQDKVAINGQTTLYTFTKGVWNQPVTQLDEMISWLKKN